MNENIELISVIVPVYNTERYLSECITSITRQTYSNLEIILVDDGSPDNCPQICDEWAKKDKRIKVIHQENGGASSARNAGLTIAQGEYIGFVDSDDVIREEMYEVLLCCLKNSHKKISCCLSTSDYQLFQAKKREMCPPVEELSTEDTINAIFRGELGTAVWRRLCKKEIFEQIRFPEFEINEEYPLLIPMSIKADGTMWVKDELYYYRQVDTSVTSSCWKTDGDIILKNLGRMYQQLQDNKINCEETFEVFAVRAIFSVSLSFDLKLDQINNRARVNFKKHLKILRKKFWWAISGDAFSKKDKLLYFMTVLRIRRPIYKIIGKI